MTASTLHDNSSIKLPIFHDSLSFYTKAQSYIQDILAAQAPTNAHYSSASSFTSSIYSSRDSIFSSPTNSARSSIASSPADELASFHKRTISTSSSFSSLSSAGGRKKKVSFSIDLSTSYDSEPQSEPVESQLLDSFPTPPTLPDPSITSSKDLQSPRRISTPPPQASQHIAYLLSQSLVRYKTHLHDLSTQLEYHISSIHKQIHQLSEVRKARRGNSPTQFTGRFEDSLIRGVTGEDREEVRKVELRERIGRLKAQGWKRKRFDGERYKVLCERALIEACEPMR